MGFAKFECILPNYNLKLNLTDPSEQELIGFFDKVEEVCRNSVVFYSPLNAESLLKEAKSKNFFDVISTMKPMVLQQDLVEKHSKFEAESSDDSLAKKVKEKNMGIKNTVLTAFLNSCYSKSDFKAKSGVTKVFLAVQTPGLTIVKKTPANPENGDVLLALVGSWNTCFNFLSSKLSLPTVKVKLNEMSSTLNSLNVPNKKLALLALMKNAGYSLMLDVEDFNRIHPESKISKPRGNFGKKK